MKFNFFTQTIGSQKNPKLKINILKIFVDNYLPSAPFEFILGNSKDHESSLLHFLYSPCVTETNFWEARFIMFDSCMWWDMEAHSLWQLNITHLSVTLYFRLVSLQLGSILVAYMYKLCNFFLVSFQFFNLTNFLLLIYW